MNVKEEFKRWADFFDSLDHCYMSDPKPKNQDGRLKITSVTKVPWSESLKPQYNEDPDKIGYLFPQKKGIKLAIDFLPRDVAADDVYRFMKPYPHIKETPADQRASGSMSWWRYNTGDDFNTLELVIRNHEIGTIKLDNEETRHFFQQIVSGDNR
ncbi:hypothetical protein [Bacillus piscicola]|uniref:hypothetical protein n=1 Tax=Bacillus piscicola TaxID=1632684 RepID=UPI001F09F7DE|nr:hypothetical protein [Bacillus piscicola]